MNREELINICRNSIVSYKKWNNRDSFIAQLNVNQCYGLLSAGAEYNYSIDNNIININFINLTKEIIYNSCFYNLDYDDVQLYKEENPDSEIFEYYNSVSDNETSCSNYIPTQELLNELDGKDWY